MTQPVGVKTLKKWLHYFPRLPARCLTYGRDSDSYTYYQLWL